MLQQTQVKTVLPFWERWMRRLPTLQCLAKAQPDLVHKLWEGLGYYSRARNLQKAARIILAEHQGKFPHHFDQLLALPGVGRYTAGAICSIAFNQPKPVLDGNVIRVLARVFGIRGDPHESKTNSELWRIAEQLVVHAAELQSGHPEKAPRRANVSSRFRSRGFVFGSCSMLNQALMELGALLCTPRRPNCASCPIARACVARQRGWTEQLPNLRRRPAPTARRFIALALEHRGRFLVRQRPAGVVNAHLWEFPNVEVAPDNGSVEQARRKLSLDSAMALAPLCTIRHSITRYRITLEVFRGVTAIASGFGPGRWLPRGQLKRLAFASAHRRIL